MSRQENETYGVETKGDHSTGFKKIKIIVEKKPGEEYGTPRRVEVPQSKTGEKK